MNDDFFGIKLDLRMMSEKLNCHIMARSNQISEMVDKSINEYCSGGNLDAQVKKEVENLLNDAVRNYFSVGGGKIIVDNEVSKALDEILNKRTGLI